MASLSPANTPCSDNMGGMGKAGIYKPAKFKKKYIKIKTNVKKTTLGLNLQGLQVPAEILNAAYNVLPDA